MDLLRTRINMWIDANTIQLVLHLTQLLWYCFDVKKTKKIAFEH
jgi:hypothetical protein